MKGVKGKLLNRLKSIRPIGYLKQQDRILHVKASDGYVEFPSKSSILKEQNRILGDQREIKKMDGICSLVQEPDVIDVCELMRDLEEDEDEDEEMDVDCDKENISPPVEEERVSVASKGFSRNDEIRAERDLNQKKVLGATGFSETSGENDREQTPLSEIDILSFRRPDLNSGTLFDPNLLAAFELAVKEHQRLTEAERIAYVEAEIALAESEQEPPLKSRRLDLHEEEDNPLLAFEERCPPAGGADSVVLYTTSLRGIRKTFDDCNSLRFLLESFRVMYCERDISMHMEFKEELWEVLNGNALPPRLFIKGRYIGGAEEVLAMHEQGKLKPLFHGIPIDDRSDGPCEGCGGFRFVLCFKCNGSHKVVAEENGLWKQCAVCNENGLIICPLCC